MAHGAWAICSVASIPSTLGMRMSITTTSGVDCSASVTASAPSLASATTVIPASARASRRTPRSRALSSAMRIRIDSATWRASLRAGPAGAQPSRAVQALDALLGRGGGGRRVGGPRPAEAVERRERVARAGRVREPPPVAGDLVLLAVDHEDAPPVGPRDQQLGNGRPAGRAGLLLVQLEGGDAVQPCGIDRAGANRPRL